MHRTRLSDGRRRIQMVCLVRSRPVVGGVNVVKCHARLIPRTRRNRIWTRNRCLCNSNGGATKTIDTRMYFLIFFFFSFQPSLTTRSFTVRRRRPADCGSCVKVGGRRIRYLFSALTVIALRYVMYVVNIAWIRHAVFVWRSVWILFSLNRRKSCRENAGPERCMSGIFVNIYRFSVTGVVGVKDFGGTDGLFRKPFGRVAIVSKVYRR